MNQLDNASRMGELLNSGLDKLGTSRRELLVGSILSAMALGLATNASASPLKTNETIVLPKNDLPWKPNPKYPAKSQDTCVLFGDMDKPGLYLTLIRWYPGYLSAPHKYSTDRICMVLSGAWYVASGTDFDPASAVPAPAGSFVRRVAETSHYDGVPTGKEITEIAIFGMGPIEYKYTGTDPAKPRWYKV